MSTAADELDLDGDEGGEDVVGRDGDDQPQHECPECSRGFASKATLGFHRWRVHGVAGSSRKSKEAGSAGGSEGKPERRPARPSKGRRAQLVSETMRELADLADSLRGRAESDGLTIAGTIRRDADRMGDALAGLAERSMFGFVGLLIDALFGAGGPLSLVTAFGPTARKTMEARPRRVGDLDDRQAEYERIYQEEGPEAAETWARSKGLQVEVADAGS